MNDISTDSASILRARARALARPPKEAPPASAALDLLEFRLAREHYAVECRFVREVHPLHDLTPLPCTPAFVLGVVQVRGRILPVFDLKPFLNLPNAALTGLHRIIQVEGEGLELGLLADSIAGMRSIPADRLQPPPPAIADHRDHYVMGVTDERLVILDLARILADPRIIVHDEVET